MNVTTQVIRHGDWALAEQLFGRAPSADWELASVGDAIVALHPLAPPHAGSWEAHIAVAKAYRGRAAVVAFRTLLRWFWGAHVDCMRLIGVTKATNRAAQHMIAAIGFQREGRYLVPWPGGIIQDTVLYTMARP